MSRYAIVINETVDNVIVSNPHNATKIANSKGGISVYADRYPIQAGDTYTDSKFFRDGIEVNRIPTPEEQIAVERARNLEQDEILLENTIEIIELKWGL